jgi:two-component system chemotaxis response regulator CheB
MSAKESSNGAGRDIIVIGASAGGVQVLQQLMSDLPEDLPASVFVVVHTSPDSPGILPQILDRAGPLHAVQAEHGEPIRKGRIYVAPPDYHLLVEKDRVLVTRGPKENGFRPAVDPLFRTAARSFGSRVIGIVLTGGLDDGTIGLMHIKSVGGIAIAQDPVEAVFPSMPQSAIDNVDVDFVLPVAQMPALVRRLVTEPASQGATMAKPGNGRPDVAEAGKAVLLEEMASGPPTAYTCPECGGALWERKDGKVLRYQCHVGHSYTADILVAEKNEQLEAVLWSALRALEENADLRRRMARRAENGPPTIRQMGQKYEKQAKEAEDRAAILRELLTNGRTSKQMANTARSHAQAKARAMRPQSLSQTTSRSRSISRAKGMKKRRNGRKIKD